MEKTVNALGRRKSAVARVYVAAGTGKIVINGKELRSISLTRLSSTL